MPKFSTARQSISKQHSKATISSDDLGQFKFEVQALLAAIQPNESEEYHKNLLAQFLRKTHYADYTINTRERIDQVIHHRGANGPVGVILEAKRPQKTPDMCTVDKLNRKALQEALLYFMRERHSGNLKLQHIIVTNVYEWFIFDAKDWDRHFYQDRDLRRDFEEIERGGWSDSRTTAFYSAVAQPKLEAKLDELELCHVDLRTVGTDKEYAALYKLLSPRHLLGEEAKQDSNSLNREFYSELLHIVGLREIKVQGKKVISRLPETERHEGSLLENTIEELRVHNTVIRMPQPERYGDTLDERLFQVALELSITWLNRILFLKLLEAQLKAYGRSQSYMQTQMLKDFDTLDELFFKVLAEKTDMRRPSVQKHFGPIPYLNSSLFEVSELEQCTLQISNLSDRLTLPYYSRTILQDSGGKKRQGECSTLEYLLAFLDAYDFGTVGNDEVQTGHKPLVNASVLGLIFEKINGYKDGSYFTPGYVTEYMANTTLARAVVGKFNAAKHWQCKDVDELFNKLDGLDLKEANAIFNTLRVCDPAVGSGHFLVSALNALVALKFRLGILCDAEGRRIRKQDYTIEVVNDELDVVDAEGDLVRYNPNSAESGRLQKALFEAKRDLIENCLFGVDINPNSVKICRLRLWIELLKHAYYRPDGELETLPNIDINIQCGNSVVQRFPLDDDLRTVLRNNRWNVPGYRALTMAYRHAKDKEERRKISDELRGARANMQAGMARNHPLLKKKEKLATQLDQFLTQGNLLEPSKTMEADIAKISAQLGTVEDEIKAYEANRIFVNAFEWRFEFPEVLDDEGNFIGFDVIIGNPPYIRQEELGDYKDHFKTSYQTYSGTADIYVYFVEQGMRLLRPGGQFSYIMPNKWMRAGYGAPLRELCTKQKLVQIVDFGDLQIFEEATTYPCIIQIENAKSDGRTEVYQVAANDLSGELAAHIAEQAYTIDVAQLGDKHWSIVRQSESGSMDRFREMQTLAQLLSDEAYYGIKTGITKAFVVTDAKYQQMTDADSTSAEVMRPFLAGRDVARYSMPSDDRGWLILFPNGWSESGLSGKTEGQKWASLQSKYPAIAEHLAEFEEKARARTDQGKYWWELRSCDYYDKFEGPKIMYQKFQVKPCFIWDDQGLYCNDSMWILPNAPKWLLGVLNSKMAWYLISKYCTQIQNGYQLIWKYFGQIPCPKPNAKLAAKLEKLTNEILNAKGKNPDADTSELEAQINSMVYEMYGMTEDEIAVVEAAVGC